MPHFVSHLKQSKHLRCPTLQFDLIYAEILSGYPDLLFVLVVQRLVPLGFNLWLLLNLLGLSYKVFQPFIGCRELSEFPFPHGDSPLDFIADPHRARNLYLDPANVAEELVLLWISRTKKILLRGDFWLHQTNAKILDELETLNLSDFCDQMSADPDHEYHHELHTDILNPLFLRCVLDWLWVTNAANECEFPDPPMRAIRFWEQQMIAIEQCSNRLPSELGKSMNFTAKI
ncbi:hypothetical protein DFH08DRAFT_817005 [Mycena albidolilacea]|uniref:Uncharacterized protein n=1 Tax=Mycena albidolilacea TaxID=1033008 RepID=A0AAD7EIY5_9AGAR|nr:hypothetical protein DFH08DRAFT_817005 [Mycena albidolilacea]